MNKSIAFVRAVIASLLVGSALVACSGSSSAPPNSTGTGLQLPGTPKSATTAPPAVAQAHFFISLGSTRGIVVSPAGAPLPSGVADAGPVANAVVTYPDGSTQIADANGNFTASNSGYARQHEATLESDTEAQPSIKVQDPARSAVATAATILGYAGSQLGSTIAGIRTLPLASELFSGDTVLLTIAAVDTVGLPANLGQANITWSAVTGTIAPILGTNTAFYTAPSVSSATLDTVTASVRTGNAVIALASTSAIATLPRSGGFSVTGTIAGSGSTSGSGSIALFTQAISPRASSSYNFFGLADANGTYRALVPATMDFATSIGVVGNAAPAGNGSFFATGTGFTSGAPGASGTANFTIAGNASPFDDRKDEAELAIAPPISQIRDAFAAASSSSVLQPWATDSGLYPILAAMPANFPSPATPTAITSGLFTGWCYQWTDTNTPTLVIVENAGTSCASPGNLALAVVPGAPNAYGFRRYAAPNGYAVGTPLDPTQGGAARLIAAGSWTHVAADADNDRASVMVDAYGPLAPQLGMPIARETLAYSFTRSNGTATTSIANDAVTDVPSGRVVATGSFAAQQKAPLDASGCFGSSQTTPCYESSGTVVRSLPTSVGIVQRTLAVATSFAGDGSDRRTIVTQSPSSDRAQIDVSLAARQARVSGSCLVCASGAAALSDEDGSTSLGTLTIDTSGVANLNILDTAPSSAPGKPLVTVTFAI
jgi:hypothetical protein